MSASDGVFASASEHVACQIDGEDFDVLTLVGDEEVSKLFRYEIGCASTYEWADPEPLLGKPVTVEIRDGAGAARTVSGIVAEADAQVFDEGRTLLTLIMRPELYRLRIGRDCRVYQDSTVVDIVSAVLARNGVKARWEVTGQYPARVYTQQYREDDWSFAERLLEEEGIYYWFDHELSPSRLVLADRSETAPDLAGGAQIDFVDETGMQTGREVIHDFGAANALTEDRHSVASFDPDRPNLSVAGETGGGSLEIYDGRGAGPNEPDVAAARVTTRVEGAKAKRSTVRGVSTSVRLAPGRTVEMGGHTAARFDGRYLVTAATVRVVQRQHESAGLQSSTPQCEFRGLTTQRAFRPPADTPWPRQRGLQTAVVVGPGGEEVHCDERGQVRVQYHWDRQGARDDTAGKWMRVVQRGTAGSMLLPRMGWNVVTFNEEGSVDQPIVLSRLFDAEHPPPYALPENKTRTVYKTATTPGDGTANEIRLEDKAGQEEMFINATRDMNLLTQDCKTEQVKGHHQRSIGLNQSVDVGQNAAENVLGSQTHTVGGNQKGSTGGGQQKTVNGDELNTVGGTRSIETGQTLTTDVTSMRCLLVGGAQIDISLGDIKATSMFHHTFVGGAVVKATFKSMLESVTGGSTTQLVGGLKVEKTGAARTLSTGGAYTETIGAILSHDAGAAYSDTAATGWSLTAGSITAEADNIVLTGAAGITLKSGGSTISILPGEVIIDSPTVNLSDAAVTVGDAAEVKMN